MKHTILDQHKDYFLKNGFIEFDEMIPQEKWDQFLTAVDQCLSRDHVHDLWRENLTIKKTIATGIIPLTAVELIKQSPLRLGYDQYIPPNEIPYFNNHSLSAISSFQGVSCGVLLCLNKNSKIIFTNEETPLNIDLNESWLLVCYTESRARYVLQPNDPYTHHLKKFGYTFGDRLNDLYNPVCHR